MGCDILQIKLGLVSSDFLIRVEDLIWGIKIGALPRVFIRAVSPGQSTNRAP